jgi:hydroxyacylglutathione hydrolase
MLEIDPIPALNDNYVWLLREPGGTVATLVDPGETIGVMKVLARLKLSLGAILVTHHHGDHTGGIRSLKQLYPEAVVYGPARESVAGVTHPVKEGDTLTLPGTDARFQVLDVPGHTAGHVAYYGEGALFCGDTLFAAGCGRVFDGTMAELAASLERIVGLPAETLIYCAHEYTLDNLGFAQWVEPESEAVRQRLADAQQLRGQYRPTVPSSLALERETNPFLRTHLPAVIAMAERQAGRSLGSSAEVFEVLRSWKDREYD